MILGTETSNVADAGLFHTGDVIRKWRALAGLTNAQLSEQSGVDSDTITRIEKGATTGKKLEAVVKALGHTMTELYAALDAGHSLTAEEARLLTAYRRMRQDMRSWLIGQAEFFRQVEPPDRPTD